MMDRRIRSRQAWELFLLRSLRSTVKTNTVTSIWMWATGCPERLNKKYTFFGGRCCFAVPSRAFRCKHPEWKWSMAGSVKRAIQSGKQTVRRPLGLSPSQHHSHPSPCWTHQQLTDFFFLPGVVGADSPDLIRTGCCSSPSSFQVVFCRQNKMTIIKGALIRAWSVWLKRLTFISTFFINWIRVAGCLTRLLTNQDLFICVTYEGVELILGRGCEQGEWIFFFFSVPCKDLVQSQERRSRCTFVQDKTIRLKKIRTCFESTDSCSQERRTSLNFWTVNQQHHLIHSDRVPCSQNEKYWL